MVDFFLPRRAEWMRRAIFTGLPVHPSTGDRGITQEALADIVDAAGGLEHSRAQLARVIAVAQAEFDQLCMGQPSLRDVHGWGGRNTPAVYSEFANAVAWTRAVDDRYGSDRLRLAVYPHDRDLWKELQKIRSSTAGVQFEDARLLAKVTLHKFTPPYSSAGAKVEGDKLIYPIPRIDDPDDFRANPLVPGRHVMSVVDDLWAAVERFVDQLLAVFYPRPSSDQSV